MVLKEKLTKVVNSDQIFDDDEVLGEYASDHSFVPIKKPSLVVKPKSAMEVQKIVNFANRLNFPLIPVSSGLPRFRGDTVPSADGVVIVDLQEMNRVIWVSRRDRVCVIEPGVTFGQLEAELESQGLRSMMPLCPKSTKSVIASHWERNPITCPRFHWDEQDPLASTEFIVGNGDSMWTGGAGLVGGLQPISPAKQRERGMAHKVPFGLLNMNVQKIGGGSQGTLGICTWASVRCELFPEHEELFVAYDENIKNLVEPATKLIYYRLADDLFILNSVNLASLLKREADDIRVLKDTLPPWILVYNLVGYGTMPEKMFEYKEVALKDKQIPAMDSLPGSSIKEVQSLIRQPSDDPYWKLRLKGDSRDLIFLTSLARAPSFIETIQKLANAVKFPISDIGVYIQPMRQGCYSHMEFDINMSTEDQAEAQVVQKLIKEAANQMFSTGAFFNRPYGELSNLIYPHYPDTVKALKIVKKIFDPKNVMSPGKLCFSEVIE